MRFIKPLSDGAAIEASWADPLAFATVFDRHWPKLYRYCAFRAGAAGEDIAAETFRVAFDERDRYDGREDAGPWLFGIATNLRELFRRGARADRALNRVTGDVELDPVDGVIDRLDAQLARPELAAVLARMSPVEREALLLHACAELSFEEIARATAVPIGTVSLRIRRAKVQTRAHFRLPGGLLMTRHPNEFSWLTDQMPDGPDQEATDRARTALIAHLKAAAPEPAVAPRPCADAAAGCCGAG